MTSVAIGQHIGKWLIERKTKHLGRVAYQCLCECGTRRNVLKQSLVSGASISCGCDRPRTRFGRTVVGDRYGYLVVLKELETRSKEGNVIFLCQCDCGSIINVEGSNLRKNHTKSCGCYKKTKNAESLRARRLIHGQSKTLAYKSFIEERRRQRKNELDNEWTLQMEMCLHIYQPVCVVCGGTKRMSTDHVLPLSRGFGLFPGNAVRLCSSCNSKKRDHMPENLSTEVRGKILRAAESFRIAWSGGF